MKKKFFLIIFLIVILSISLVILTGCENSKVEENNSKPTSNNIDNNKTEENTQKTSKQMTIDAWFNLPENLDYYYEKSYSDGMISIEQQHKRGNDIMIKLRNSNYYFYKYTGNNIWTSKEYVNGKGWDNYYYIGCIITVPGSSEEMMLKKLDNYTTEHEKFNVEGVGEVDTVIGKDGNDIYYYSKDLNINVKVITTNITLVVTKYDKNVTDYPIAPPNNI